MLAYYNIQKEHTLHLALLIPIRVERETGDFALVMCKTTDTLGEIIARLGAERGFPPDEQCVVFMRDT